MVGGKCRAELYLILIMTRLVPMSLSAYRHAAKGFISCNLHSHSPTLYPYPNPLPHKQTDIPKKRIDARRCGHPPTGEETKIAWTCFVTVQAAVKWHGRRHNIGSIGP